MEENEIFSLKMGNLFSGLEIIRLNNVEERFALDAEDQFQDLEGAKNKGRLIERLQEIVLENISLLLSLATLAYVTVMMVQGQFTLATAMLLLQLAGNIAWPLIGLFGMRNRLIASNKVFQTLLSSGEDAAEEEKSTAETASSKAKDIDLLGGDIEIGRASCRERV